MTFRFSLFIFFFEFAISNFSHATVITENFSTLTKKNSSSLVWNTAINSLHPPLQVTNLQAPAEAVTSTPISIGDGHHGVFDSTTYTNFGTLVGSVLTIDASIFPILEVKSFTLDSTTTIRVVNGPFIIYSLSTVQIDGMIDCRGADGSPAVGATGGAGGVGRCGGMTGGNGGNASSSGTSSLPLAGLVTGGGGGTYSGVAAGAGGGGGGAYGGNPGAAGTNSVPATNAGGTAGNGAAGANYQFTILNGSPGGGGGSGSNTEGGGGGGGGGGTVIIHAGGNVTVSATGMILALGGNGGAANTGGGGGGGGGGGVNIITRGDFHLDSGTPIDVSGGSGGISVSASAGDGGAGSYGRIWDISPTFSGAGSESHGSGLLQLGDVEYQVATFTAVTNSYDSSADTTTYNSLLTTSVDPGITLEIAGSSDNFSTDDSGWIAAASIASINLKRYFKLRFTLNNASPTLLNQITNVSLDFTVPTPPPAPPASTPSQNIEVTPTENFQFKSGCGHIENYNPHKLTLLMMIVFLFLPLTLLFKLRLKKVKAKI